MTPIEIARKLAEYEQTQEAQRAYTLALQQDGTTAEERLEAANYIFFSQGNYKVAYTTFVTLYNQGYFQEELLDLMTQAFYLLNVKEQRRRYQDNCERLSRYPYLFRKDFPEFEQLPIQFFPFDDNGYLPYFPTVGRFGDYINLNDPVIDRNFFHDLENPILAKDVISQYQLEYLNDNVRKSEWVGRENHIYLHYERWDVFCAYLQCLEWKELLRDRKIVFLIGDELSQYPIDFQARFGIDYSKYPVRPVHPQEVTRLIWHTQLSSHNGGDFFNEIFHGHPNLLTTESMIFSTLEEIIQKCRKELENLNKRGQALPPELEGMDFRSDKDVLVASLLEYENSCRGLDRASRIVPAVFLQPHFENLFYQMSVNSDGDCTLFSEQYESIRSSALFQSFKYIKTFTPMRRITTSYAATIRYMLDERAQGDKNRVVQDLLTERLLNRSFMVDRQDRLYHDSVLVRFEDGKLNPKATFTALAQFLDLPYTESMTYCSGKDGINPESLEGNVRGFDLATVYRTYDEYANADERAFLEYFMRDAYQFYGYDFRYYHNEPVDGRWIEEKIRNFTTLDSCIETSWRKTLAARIKDLPESDKEFGGIIQDILSRYHAKRLQVAQILLKGLRFVNKQGQPLHMMTPLKLDPALLEQPLYH